MNTAETQIQTAPKLTPGALAPITRIGAGEVRVDRALATKTVAWVAESESAAVSFGYATVADEREFRQRIHVHNFANVGRT